MAGHGTRIDGDGDDDRPWTNDFPPRLTFFMPCAWATAAPFTQIIMQD